MRAYVLTPRGVLAPARPGEDFLDVGVSYGHWEARNPGVTPWRKNGPIAAHWICVVSPEWIATGGDPHDPDTNPRIRELMHAARNWAGEAGLGEVLHCRYDVDETGSGLVDLITVPTHTTPQGRRIISVNKALHGVATAQKRHRSEAFKALQDSWSAHLQAHVDPTIERGTPKQTRAKDRLTPEEYGTAAEWVKAQRRRDLELSAEAARLEVEGAALEATGERIEVEAARAAYETERAEEAQALADGRLARAAEAERQLRDERAAAVRQAEGWLVAAVGKRGPA